MHNENQEQEQSTLLLLTLPLLGNVRLRLLAFPKLLPNRPPLLSLAQQNGNILLTLVHRMRIVLFSISSLKLLNGLAFFIKPDSPTGSFQFLGVHIRRLLP